MERGALEGRSAFWLRCRLTREQKGVGAYRRSPELQGFKLESRGGTVSARHAITVRDEMLGRSEGLPGERYKLMHSPVLSRSEDDCLIVETPGLEGENQTWVEVHDFASSEANDLHYTLEDLSGVITFGPTVLQPDGSAYRFGAIPPKDSNIRMARYQYGGGVIGNLPARALNVLKTSVPYVARVTNRQASVGGRDAQTLEDAKLRAPELLRSRTRAVTVDDYEFLAISVDGVARVHCQGPSAIGEPGSPKPGEVFVTILPSIEEPNGRIVPDALVLSADVLSRITAHLEERRLIGTTLKVRPAQLVWLSVSARVRVREGSPPELLADTQARAEAALYAYLNPYVGGPDGNGWEFGRDLHQAEVTSVLQRLEGIEFVDEVLIKISEPGSSATATAAPNRLALPQHAVVCSDRHLVTVR
jgi:predicted phage baseplate assembly protein